MNTPLINPWHPFGQSRRPRRGWPLWGGSLLAGLMLLAGCSHPARPGTAPRPAVITLAQPAVIPPAPPETSETRFLAAVSQARIFVEDRPDYAAALTHLDHLENLCVRSAAEPHCAGPAYFRWQERKQYLQTVRRTLVAQYNAHLSQVQTQWRAAQQQFICEAAAADLQTAQQITAAQNDKRFNWRGLRDEPEQWAKAAALCDRVLGEPRVDSLINLAAARQKTEITRRLGRKGKDFYALLRPLPGYETLPGYPAATPAALHQAAHQIWRQSRPVRPLILQPLIQEDAVVTLATHPGTPPE